MTPRFRANLVEMAFHGFFYCPDCERATQPEADHQVLWPVCGHADCQSTAPLEWRQPIFTNENKPLRI